MLTSYFGGIRKLDGKRLISISRGTPVWFQGERLECLAPSWNLIKVAKEGKLEEYTERYYSEVLNKLNARYLYRCYCDSILLCYEAPPPLYSDRELYLSGPYFCHRHIVSDWFRKHGLECEEVRI